MLREKLGSQEQGSDSMIVRVLLVTFKEEDISGSEAAWGNFQEKDNVLFFF